MIAIVRKLAIGHLRKADIGLIAPRDQHHWWPFHQMPPLNYPFLATPNQIGALFWQRPIFMEKTANNCRTGSVFLSKR